MRNIYLMSALAATLIVASSISFAQVKTEQGGKGVSEPSEKPELGRTDPKEDAAPSATEPKGGVQVKGQPEPNKPNSGYK